MRLTIPLPDGRRISLPLAYVRRAGGGAEAAVRKDAGDDPDVTNGALIAAALAWSDGAGVEFAAGEGVGTVTKPGLALPPGEAAINPVPRRMIAAGRPGGHAPGRPGNDLHPRRRGDRPKDLQPADRHRRGALDPGDDGDRPPLQLLGAPRIA